MVKRANRTVAKLERLVGCEWAWVLAFMADGGPAALNDIEAVINECRERGVKRSGISYDVCVERVSSILRELRFTRKAGVPQRGLRMPEHALRRRKGDPGAEGLRGRERRGDS